MGGGEFSLTILDISGEPSNFSHYVLSAYSNTSMAIFEEMDSIQTDNHNPTSSLAQPFPSSWDSRESSF